MSLKQILRGGASAIAVLVAAPVLAQSTETDPAATANVAGGQVIVEQEDATVDVTVPEPDVNVTQAAPIVTVEQPQPEITVTVPEPTVRVQQQAPIITVEQAQPQITVRIPEPIVTVQVPRPEVDVSTGEPVVDLQQPEPVVRFVRPEPKITIEESEPRVSVESAEANVNIDANSEARVDVQQAEADVTVEQSESADVNVAAASAEPEVNVTRDGEASIDVEQAQARVLIEDFNEDASGNLADADRERYETAVRELPLFNKRTSELVGRSVATETGEDVGEIDFIGKRGDKLVAIIGVGGFLGMGENEVAIPVQKLMLREDEIIVPEVTQAQLEAMPEFNEAEVELLNADIRLAEAIGLD